MKINAKVAYYESFDDDFVQSACQDFEIAQDYSYLEQRLAPAALAALMRPAVRAFARLHSKIVLCRQIRDERTELPPRGEGFYVFCNHTQPLGDALITQFVARPARPYIIVSQANLGIPVVGKLLPAFGALPLPSCRSGLARLDAAVHQRIAEGGAVFVYPEAHVWPWYTEIRPLPTSAFHFAAQDGAASYCLTTTYQTPAGLRRKPRVTTFFDGPFFADDGLGARAARASLRDKVQACMESRSKESTYRYVEYVAIQPREERSRWT